MGIFNSPITLYQLCSIFTLGAAATYLKSLRDFFNETKKGEARSSQESLPEARESERCKFLSKYTVITCSLQSL